MICLDLALGSAASRSRMAFDLLPGFLPGFPFPGLDGALDLAMMSPEVVRRDATNTKDVVAWAKGLAIWTKGPPVNCVATQACSAVPNAAWRAASPNASDRVGWPWTVRAPSSALPENSMTGPAP